MLIAVSTAGPVDPDAVEYTQACLTAALGVETVRLPPLPDPEYAFDAARNQYSSTLILRDALRRMPPDAGKMLVLTERDLFIPMLSFVYGQAQLDGAVAVLSLARLHQEFYGLPSQPPLFLVRVRKEVLHEMGHTFGLTHCEDRLCAMALSTNIEQLDTKRGTYCDGCAVLLHDSEATTDVAGTQGDSA